MVALALAASAQLAARPANGAALLRPGGSTEVMFAYPVSPDAISVGRTGEATFTLRIPTFPAYVQPDLQAVYSSRGGDGLLGMGWSIPIAHLRIDLSNGPSVLDTSPDANIVTVGGKRYLRGRWQAAPGGPLVCEPRPGATGTSWKQHDCFTDPRGPIRYQPSGGDDALSWTATDPMEGVTQTFGASAASRVTSGADVVTWLLARETSREGKEVRHFYEERKGSDERLRVAVLMGGNKVIRFLYKKRTTNLFSSYRWTTRRASEHLLDEIRLLDGCVPVQRDTAADDIWTDFGACEAAKVREKIVITYRDTGRYTGRHVMASWQHQSGDGTVAYQPVRFDYNGDGDSARATGAGIVDTETATFPMPEGSTLVSSGGNSPFQSYVDWNRDGLADWVDAKNDTAAEWPQPTSRHEIHVSLRNASQGFDARKSYKDPIAHTAAWIWDDGSSLEVHRNAMDKRDPIANQLPTTRAAAPALIRAMWPSAVIGINSSPWLYREPQKDDKTLYLPSIEGLSLTLKCSKLGTDVCGDIKDTYRNVWSATLGDHDHVGVKLIDLQDYDGDGYLDRVVSGLLVVWDPNAPDADASGWRDPADGQPCVYVARFDPAADDFRPFVRYAIARAGGEFAGLDTAFTSALAVEVTHNQEPGGGDMSNHAGPMSGLSVAQASLDFLGSLASFADRHASVLKPTGEKAGGGSTIAADTMTGIDVVLGVANAAAQWGGAPPQVQQALRGTSMVYGMGKSAFTAQASLRMALSGTGKIGGVTLSTTAARAVGWTSFAAAIVAVAGAITSAVVLSTAKKHMVALGWNPGAVAAMTKTTLSVISIVVASVGLIAIGVSIAATGLALSWAGVGVILMAIGGLVALVAAIGALLSKEGSVEWAAGEIDFDYFVHRGQVWRDKDVNSHDGTMRVLSTWTDLDGDGRIDLVVGRRGSAGAGFAIASGDVTEGYAAPATAAWKRWDIAGSGVPTELFLIEDRFHFKADDVQRGDQLDVKRGLGDLNGDGLLDLIDTSASGTYGIGVFLNTGRGFAAKTTFAADQASAPASCDRPLHLARSRGLAWTESVDKKSGYSVSLSNTIQMLGPDLDNNGLPDLVMKDERSYGTIASASACTLVRDAGMCDSAMPTDPEPEKGNEDCTAAEDVWFARFDGFGTQNGTDEGESHLTPAAFDVHSPTTVADTYVAFNTGTGFTKFVKLDRKLPSFAGGLSVVSTTNAVNHVPSEAVTGTSHFLADPDASGRMHLIGLDITQQAIWNPKGSHPVKHRFAIGIENPDALTRITFPDGGVADLAYRIHAEVKGEQGPPLWVLDRVTFDDKVRGPLQALEGWSGSKPSVTYHYDGARLVGREFLGFAAIAEERTSGTDTTQIIQTFSQTGPTRGAILCTETRGAANDRLPAGTVKEHTTCDVDRTPTRAGEPDEAAPRIESCYAKAEARLGLPALHPLQRRVESAYTSTASVSRRLPDGTSGDVQRDFDLTRLTTTTYNATSRTSWTRLDIAYDAAPYKTPRESALTSSDGIQRKVVSTWKHKRAEWAFLKERQEERERSGAVRLDTRFRHDPATPFHLRSVTETSGAETRTREFLAFDGGGLPTRIREGGRTSTYTYVGDNACGTALLATVTHTGDAFQPSTGTERWTYDCLGRTTRHETATGDVSTFDYDRLGVIAKEKPAGRGAIEYRHYVGTGAVSVGRDAGSLSSGPRTQRVETAGGEQRWTTIWWDGYFREFRRGVSVEATRYVDFDWNGDGTADQARVAFADDTAWFAANNAQHLLTDRLLNAVGEVQCRSLPYLDGRKPAAYASSLFDPLRRVTSHRRVDRFDERSTFGVDTAGHTTERIVNTLGDGRTVVTDTVGRRVSDDAYGLGTTRYRHGDWGAWTRTTDGAGFVRLAERNGWDQPLRECRQLAGPAPADDLCPAGWPTTTTRYDGGGRVDRITDPRGVVTTIKNAVCGAAGRVDLPPATTGDPATVARIETRYDAACRPIQVQDPNGAITTLHYEPGGEIARTVRAKGTRDETTSRLGYDELGRLLWTQDGLRRRSYQIHDFRDRVLYAYAPDATRTATTYGVHGFAETTTDATAVVRTMRNDLMGRPTQVSWSRAVCGAVTPTTVPTTTTTVTRRFAYDPKGRLVDQWDELGNRTHFALDALDRPTRSYPPSLTTPGDYDTAQYTETTYDRAGNAVATRDRGGHVTNHVFDGGGRRTATWSVASGHRIEERFEHDLAGNLTRYLPPDAQATKTCTVGATTPDAFAIDYTYSPRGLLETATEPAAAGGTRAVARTRHDAAGDAVEITDLRGFPAKYDHDLLHRLQQITGVDGAVVKLTYDDASQVTEVRDPRRLATTYVYDALGRPTVVTPPTGAPTHRGYDAAGRLTFEASLADVAANRWEATRLTYGPDGTLRATEAARFTGATPTASALVPLDRAESCTDAAGRVLAVRDPNGNVGRRVYDARGRQIEALLTPVYGGGWESVKYTYDADDLVTEVRAPMGGTSAPASLGWKTTYDGAHRPIKAAEPSAADHVEWEYEDDGQLCRRRNIHGGTATSREVTLRHDARGLVVERKASGGSAETFEYDAGGMLTRAKDASATWAWKRDASGRVLEQDQHVTRLGLGVTVGFSYLPGGLVSEVRYPAIPGFGAAPKKLTIEYETTSDRLRRVRTDRGVVAEKLVYDGRDRIVGATLGNGAVHGDKLDFHGRLAERRVRFGAGDVVAMRYGRDAAGNIVSIDDQLDNAFDRTFTYDARGRLASEQATALGGTWAFKLNSQDRVDQVTPPAGAARTHRYDARGNLATVAGGAPLTYATDDFGNRVRDDGNGARYRYDAFDRMVDAKQGATTIANVYAFDGRRVEHGEHVALLGLDHLPLVDLELDAGGKPKGATFRVDFLGLAQLVDGASGKAAYTSVDHLGSPIAFMGATPGGEQYAAYSATGRPVPRPGGSAIPPSPLGFQGAIADRTLGLDLMLHRHYDPGTFEWLSSDPLGLVAGVAPHAFAAANPVRHVDPLGLDDVPADQVPAPQYVEFPARWVTGDRVPGNPVSSNTWTDYLLTSAQTFHDYLAPVHELTDYIAGPDNRLMLMQADDVKRLLHVAIDLPSIIKGDPQHAGGYRDPIHHMMHAIVDGTNQQTVLATTHVGLDVAGLVFPPADAANAVIYLAEDRPADALVSAVSIVPWLDLAKAYRVPLFFGRVAHLSPILLSTSDAQAASGSWLDLVTYSGRGRLPWQLRVDARGPNASSRLLPNEVEVYNRLGPALPRASCPTCGTPAPYRYHGETGGISAGEGLGKLIPGAQVVGVAASRDNCLGCGWKIGQSGLYSPTPRVALRRSAFGSQAEMDFVGAHLQGRALQLHGFLPPGTQGYTTTSVTRIWLPD